MKDRTSKALAPILAASILLYTPSAFALRGGPYDNGQVSSATAGGTYAGVITGNNLIGMVQFGVSDNSEPDGRFTVFHEGILSYGMCQGVADPNNGQIAGALLGLAPLPGETTPSGGTSVNAIQTLTVRTSAEGMFTAEMEGYPVNITFEGDGELSTVANPVTTTADAAGNDVIVTGGGTADNGTNNGPLSATAVTSTTVEGTTVRARTPFEIRGSRTSLTQYVSATTFTGTPLIDPGSTPAPVAP
ncbi:MAG TPA: hypothetical protein VFG14_19650 [Chthoniobacteraceae bacterium]|nr:hypothetical protein [Chthoniobacteraceae bacterium]